MRLARLFLIGFFLLLLALPGLQTRYRFVPEVALAGVLNEREQPRFSPRAWWRGDFQSQAAAWFDDRIGFRGHAVRTDNQIGLSLFQEASSKAVDTPRLGRRMMVYTDIYVTAYDGIDLFDDRRLRRLARRLLRLQEGLSRRGIAFVFLITPSKASIYPEYLPPGFVRPDGQRPPTAYQRMLPLLRSRGVHLVDGHAIFEEEKARSPHALFPPGGVHWNRYGAALVLRRAWQRLGEQLGRSLVDLRCRAVLEDDSPVPRDQETDGVDLLNAWYVGHADWSFPRPDLFTDDSGDASRPKLVVVGDSFWWVAEALVARHRLASRYNFFYYFNEPGHPYGAKRSMANQPGGLPEWMSWEYVFSADAVVVEANEATIGDAGWGFVEAAVKALEGSHFPAAGSAASGTGPALPARHRAEERDRGALVARQDRVR